MTFTVNAIKIKSVPPFNLAMAIIVTKTAQQSTTPKQEPKEPPMMTTMLESITMLMLN